MSQVTETKKKKKKTRQKVISIAGWTHRGDKGRKTKSRIYRGGTSGRKETKQKRRTAAVTSPKVVDRSRFQSEDNLLSLFFSSSSVIFIWCRRDFDFFTELVAFCFEKLKKLKAVFFLWRISLDHFGFELFLNFVFKLQEIILTFNLIFD